MGVSVSTGMIDTLIGHFGLQEFGAACKAFMLEKQLGLFVVIAIQAHDDGSVNKNILVFESGDNPVD